ncbi:Guanine exchange factor for Rac 30 [Pelomyxa schiedti]|nr:Guanine exchange factor for Rac 30 [Pelomyxa schiedti]
MHFILGVKDIPVAGKCPETSSSESLQEPSSILSNNNVLPDSHPEQHQGADSLPPTQSNTSSQSLTPCNQMHTHNHQAPQPDTPSEETQHQTQVQLLETQVSSPSVETATEKGHCSDIHSQIQITETPTQSCQLSEHQILPPTQESVQTTETLTTPVNQPQIQQNQIPESQVQTDIEKAAETQPEIQIPEPIQTQVEVPAPTETQVEVPERESTPEVQHETQIPAPTQAQVEVPEPTQSQVEVPEPTQTQVEIPEPPSAQIPTPEIQESKELVETELQIQTCTEVPVLLVKTSETEVSTSQTVSGLHPLSNSQPLIESAVGTTEPIIDLQPKPSLSNDSLDQVNEEPASYTLAESPHLPKSEASLDGLSPYRKLLSPRYRSYEDDVDSSSDSEAENLKEEELRLAIEIARAAAADEELQAEIKKKKRAEKEEKRKQEEEELRVAEQKLLEEQLEAMQHSKEEEKAQLVENERMERERLDQQLAHAKAEEVKSAQDKMKQELEQLERQMEEKQKQIEQLRINAALQAKQQAIERKRKQEIRKKNKLIREQRRQEKEQELLEEAQNKILEEEARLKEALASRKAAKERRRQERMAKRKAAEEEKARLAAEELAREKEEQSKTEAMEQARILEEKAQKEAAEAAKISASNHRRQNIVTEIYTTEKTYIEALNRLIWDYERSMLAACGTTSAILTPEEITAIFSNLDTIVSYHTMLLEGITVRVKSWTDTALIGDLFISSATHLRCYVEYINNYDHCLATISELLKTNKKFKDFLQRVERTHLLSLTATLIYPVQRIPRYILLLTDLHRNTPSSHPDNQNILLAIQALKATGDYLNEKKREAESTAKLHEIQEAVYGRHKPDINVPGRLFVREGFVKLERSGKWRPAVLHLCDDLILFSKLKGKMKYHLKHVIPLDSVALLSQLAWQDLPKGSTPDLCLRVWEKSKNISVTFEASDAASKQGWFLAINAAADKRANKTERS